MWVCDQHQQAAKDFILNDENREKLVALLVDNNFGNVDICTGMVKHNADVEFFDPFDEMNAYA